MVSVAVVSDDRVAEGLIVSVVVYEKLSLLLSSNPRLEFSGFEVGGKHNRARAWPAARKGAKKCCDCSWSNVLCWELFRLIESSS